MQKTDGAASLPLCWLSWAAASVCTIQHSLTCATCVLLPAVTCQACSAGQAYFMEVQTRSADEPATIFYRCVECEFIWKEG